MKKKELVHLHQLLSKVSEQYDEWGINHDTSTYDGLGVKPTSLHKSKPGHKKAVFSLLHEINDTGNTEEVLENLNDPHNTVTWENAINRLEQHSEPVDENEPGYAVAELDKKTVNSLGLQPYNKLEKLREEGLITPPQRVAPGTPREEYGPGSTIYLLE